MVKKFFISFLLIITFNLLAQDSTGNKFRYHSILKGDATISPGFSLRTTNQNNIYINGSLEYFAQDKVSLRGEGFLFVGAQNKPALLKENSCLLYGALYHFHRDRLDGFIGLEVGASLTQPNPTRDSTLGQALQGNVIVSYTRDYNSKVVPVISPMIGVTFYASNYFNFFLNAHYIRATYYGYSRGTNMPLDELRISAGLGFLIHAKKPH